jgi:hypothetical protein
MEKFSVSLPLTSEYLTTVRLTTGGLCALVGFDMEATEDFKVCVTESLLLLKRNGFARAELVFTAAETLKCEAIGKDQTENKEETLEDDISRALLSALLGEVQFISDETGAVVAIAFEG